MAGYGQSVMLLLLLLLLLQRTTIATSHHTPHHYHYQAAFYELLCRSTVLQVVRCKNKLAQTDLSAAARTVLHVNVVLDGHVGEIQLVFYDFAQIKVGDTHH